MIRPLILTDICVLTLSLISADTCSLLEGTTRILLSEALGAIIIFPSSMLEIVISISFVFTENIKQTNIICCEICLMGI